MIDQTIKKLLVSKYNIDNDDSVLCKVFVKHARVLWKIIFSNNKRLWMRFLGVEDTDQLQYFNDKSKNLSLDDNQKLQVFVY